MLVSIDLFCWDCFFPENPIFNGKIYGVRLGFSLKPIHCIQVTRKNGELAFLVIAIVRCWLMCEIQI